MAHIKKTPRQIRQEEAGRKFLRERERRASLLGGGRRAREQASREIREREEVGKRILKVRLQTEAATKIEVARQLQIEAVRRTKSFLTAKRLKALRGPTKLTSSELQNIKSNMFREEKRLETKFDRGTATPKDQLERSSLIITRKLIDAGIATRDIPKLANEIRKNPKLLKDLPKKLKEAPKKFGRTAQFDPIKTSSQIAAEIGIIVAADKGIGKVAKLGRAATVKTLGKPVKKTPLGIKVIKDVKKVGDIEIIPPGKRPRLDVSPERAVAESSKQINKLLKAKPKIPKTKAIEKDILKVVRKEGEIVGGSFSTEALLRKRFARKHKDLDIFVKDREKFIRALKKELGDRVRFKRAAASIKVIHRGREVADIVKLSKAEGGFVKKLGVVKVRGLKLAKPQARVGGKAIQLKAGKRTKKVTKDLENLFGKTTDLNSAATRGAFGFSAKEQKKLIGKSGPLTTSQENLLTKKLGGPKKLKLKRYLFATPFNPKTGKAQVRVSRLGLTKAEQAGWIDLLGYGNEVTFARQTKPQIFVFPKEKIVKRTKIKPGIKRAKAKFEKTKGFEIPEFSSELEVVLGKGFAIKRGKVLDRVNLNGNLVPIVEMKKIKLSKQTRDLVKTRDQLVRKLSQKKTKKLTARDKVTIQKIKVKQKQLARNLKKETGIDYLAITSRAKRKPNVKRVNVKNLSSKIIGSKLKRTKSPLVLSPRARPGKITPRPKPIPPSGPPTPPPRFRKDTSPRPRPRPPLRPSGPPPVPRPRPGRGPLKKTAIFRKKKRRLKKSKKIEVGFDIYGKSGKKFYKLNKKPLSKKDARDRGAFAIDNTTSKTLKLIPKGRVRKLGTIKNKEKGYFGRRQKKFRDFKIKKGRTIRLRRAYIEKRRFGIDTRGEVNQLRLEKLIKREGYTKRLTSLKSVRKRRKRR